jgi:hypothetical protein
MYFPLLLHRATLNKSVNDFYESSFHTLDSILNKKKIIVKFSAADVKHYSKCK